MGMKLDAKTRIKLGKPAVEGSVRLWLAGAPPPVTHHAKTIGKRGRRMTILNDPRLNAAHAWHALRIRRTDTAIAGPVLALVSWYFPMPMSRRPRPGEEAGRSMQRKPDLDNLAKVLFDELARAGWLVADEQVARCALSKLWADPGSEGILVELHTMAGLPRARTGKPVGSNFGVLVPHSGVRVVESRRGVTP